MQMCVLDYPQLYVPFQMLKKNVDYLLLYLNRTFLEYFESKMEGGQNYFQLPLSTSPQQQTRYFGFIMEMIGGRSGESCH